MGKRQEEVNELALFAGAGGGILGGKLLGWKTVCAVEIDEYCRRVLMQRQDDGILKPFPIWDDVQTFDGTPWRGCVDVVTGGFPCQDISAAGKGAGIGGERSGLWREMARIIREVGPKHVFVENSPMLTSRGLGTVLGDLAALGYDARWGVLGARHVGAPHKRDRIWILANFPNSRHGLQPQWPRDKGQAGKWEAERCEPWGNGEAQYMADAKNSKPEWRRYRAGRGVGVPVNDEREGQERADWWSAEPSVGRVAHGVANRVDRHRVIGNGQVPAVAALAWRTLLRL